MTQHFQVATIILKLALIDPPIRGLLRLMGAICLISPTLKPLFLAATEFATKGFSGYHFLRDCFSFVSSKV